MKALAKFIAILVLVATGCETKEKKTKPSFTNEESVAAIEKMGGKVRLAKDKPGVPVSIEVEGNRHPPESPLYKDDRPNFTDEDCVYLEGMTELTRLNLGHSKITDVGLASIKELTKINWLYLQGTDITDEGLVNLSGLTSLKSMWLRQTEITDAGLVHLKGLTTLKLLSLKETSVTDAGLIHLTGLTNLDMLILEDTKVTMYGIRPLKAALPNCTIRYDPGLDFQLE